MDPVDHQNLYLSELKLPVPSHLSELPECATLSCQQNSRCMEEALTGRLVCQCLPGYEKSGPQCLREFRHEPRASAVF